jgi:hypothetical protein
VLVGRAVAFARTKAYARKQQQQASGSSDSPAADVSAASAAAQHKHQHIPVSEPGVMVPGLTKGRDPEVQLQEEQAAAENAEVGGWNSLRMSLCTEPASICVRTIDLTSSAASLTAALQCA